MLLELSLLVPVLAVIIAVLVDSLEADREGRRAGGQEEVAAVTHPLPNADAGRGRPSPVLGVPMSSRRRCLALITIVGLSGCAKGQLNDFLFGPSTTSREVLPTPQPSATPPPTPEPLPTPAPTPSPDDGHPDNNAAVAKVTARVFFVECGGTEIPGSEYASEAPVGCRLHLDCTPRDIYHQPTRPRGGPSWSWTSGLTAGGGRGDYTPVLMIQQAGTFTASVTIDGARSNDVVVRFY